MSAFCQIAAKIPGDAVSVIVRPSLVAHGVDNKGSPLWTIGLFELLVAANGSNSDTAKAHRVALTMPRGFDYPPGNYLADKL
jgi:hypothetical protein